MRNRRTDLVYMYSVCRACQTPRVPAHRQSQRVMTTRTLNDRFPTIDHAAVLGRHPRSLCTDGMGPLMAIMAVVVALVIAHVGLCVRQLAPAPHMQVLGYLNGPRVAALGTLRGKRHVLKEWKRRKSGSADESLVP